MKTPHDADVLFGDIRPEGSLLTDAEKLEYKKKYAKMKRDQKKDWLVEQIKMNVSL